jgi:hypothetical protein
MTFRNGSRISPARSPQRAVCERLSQRLENLAARKGRFSNAEIIRRMREAAFADLEGWQVKLPQPEAVSVKPDPGESD